MVHGFKAQAERYGEEYRKKCNLSIFAKLDAFDLAKVLNVKFYTPAEVLGNIHTSCLEILTNGDTQFNALYLKLKSNEKIIIYNDSHPKSRQQSSIMHELAHIILEHEIPDKALEVLLKYNLPYINEEQEEQAKFLGGCLQLNKPTLLLARKENWSDVQIAEKYLCSVDMVKYRKKCLGLHNKWSN